jgi:hypothetical protein
MAIERYSGVVTLLHKMASNEHFKDRKYLKLKAEVEQARLACDMARAALRVHREGHKEPA